MEKKKQNKTRRRNYGKKSKTTLFSLITLYNQEREPPRHVIPSISQCGNAGAPMPAAARESATGPDSQAHQASRDDLEVTSHGHYLRPR